MVQQEDSGDSGDASDGQRDEAARRSEQGAGEQAVQKVLIEVSDALQLVLEQQVDQVAVRAEKEASLLSVTRSGGRSGPFQ